MDFLEEQTESFASWNNVFHIVHERDGIVINEFDCTNKVMVDGIKRLFDCMFHTATKPAAYYLGLLATGAEGTSHGVYTSTDATYATLPTFVTGGTPVEFTGYTNSSSVGNRPVCSFVASTTSGSTVNVSHASGQTIEFRITATPANGISGIAVFGGPATGDILTPGNSNASGGLLWAVAPFTSVTPVAANDVFKVSYTVSLTSA